MSEKIPGAPNFTWEELAVSNSHPELVRPVPTHLRPNAEEIAGRVQVIRNTIHRPIRVLSCYRPLDLNRAIGGSATSQHLQADAMDITFVGIEDTWLRLVKGEIDTGCGQCIYYPKRWFIHIANPSKKYPEPSFHIHEPPLGYHYHKVRSYDEAVAILQEIK